MIDRVSPASGKPTEAELLAALRRLVAAVEEHDNPRDCGLDASHPSVTSARALLARSERP